MPNSTYYEMISSFKEIAVSVQGTMTSLEEALRHFDMYWNEVYEDVNEILNDLAAESSQSIDDVQAVYHFYLSNRY